VGFTPREGSIPSSGTSIQSTTYDDPVVPVFAGSDCPAWDNFTNFMWSRRRAYAASNEFVRVLRYVDVMDMLA